MEFRLYQNFAQNFANNLGSIFRKKMRPSTLKIAQMAKLRPIWSVESSVQLSVFRLKRVCARVFKLGKVFFYTLGCISGQKKFTWHLGKTTVDQEVLKHDDISRNIECN